VTTSRLETFSDGVLAIAATLLVISVTVDARGGALGHALGHSWPKYAAYGVSFVTIGIWWVNHHAFLEMLGRSDRRFLFANIAFLGCIAFLPFPTGLVAEHLRDGGVRAAALAYGLTMTAAAVCFAGSWLYASKGRRLIRDSVEQRKVDEMTRSVLPGAPINAVATVVAIWSPYTALVLFAALSLFYVVGSSVFARDN
jgi:uncharacterized membrane protein